MPGVPAYSCGHISASLIIRYPLIIRAHLLGAPPQQNLDMRAGGPDVEGAAGQLGRTGRLEDWKTGSPSRTVEIEREQRNQREHLRERHKRSRPWTIN